MQNNQDKLVLDTSFISSLYKVDDALHAQAIEIFKNQVSGKEIIVPITVILELSLLSQSYNNFNNFQNYLNYLNFTTYYLDIFFEAELNDYLYKTNRNNKFKLKSMDLSVLLCALSTQSKLITFDKKLFRAYEEMYPLYKVD
jgi:predicted nucleic acid-binding protein